MDRASTICPSCGQQELLSVTLTLQELPITFTSCNACEWKGWDRQGQTVSLGDVLESASATRR